MRRPPLSELRGVLASAGFRPTKTRGQNFLLDNNMVGAIARDARVGEGDVVLEVGVGCGFLTRELLDLGVTLIAVEIDPRLLDVARGWLGDTGETTFLVADALAGKHALAPELLEALPADRPWHLVANLPYSIAGPLLGSAARLPNPFESATVLVQREVAERVAAAPGDAARGALTARLELRYAARLGRPVPARLFWPRPRVESAVVRLVRDEPPGLDAERIEAYDRLVETLFRHRRKQVLGSLARALGAREAAEGALAAVGAAPDARPGDLPAAALLALADAEAWRARFR